MYLNGLRFSCCVILSIGWATAAFAQSGDGDCRAEARRNPPRTVISCPNGVNIVAEQGTTFSLADRAPEAGPEAARLDGQALLLKVPPSDAGFEVITPQAIAAVRGTKWAVDVADGKTSVFVVEGRVAVSRRPGDPEVTLEAGDGVDVAAGNEPLTVRKWGAARVAALLARFGE